MHVFELATIKHLLLGAFVFMSITANNATATAEPQAPLNPARYELNTLLMNMTFMISGPSRAKPGETSVGTGFIVGKPVKDKDFSYFVLVTAAHVFDDIAGETAFINTRARQPDGSYQVTEYPIKIRDGAKNNFVKHPELDVAAIFTGLPDHYKAEILIGDAVLATEEDLAKYEVHPGDELLCLGYPLGAAGPFGFPILRSGKIASFPLLPVKSNKTWAFDFSVFGGNSGGPVYMVDHARTYQGHIHLGETLQMIIGLVTQRASVGTQDLHLGVVIPAAFIKETIDLLPDAPLQ